MNEEILVSKNGSDSTASAALAGAYLRSFAGATRLIGDFDAFYAALTRLIEEDPYLAGALDISDCLSCSVPMPDFENLDAGETVLSLDTYRSEGGRTTEHSGYLKYRGRRDGALFSADDLHLMGAIAGFVSVLTAQAEQFRHKEASARVFQYLLNQLPLGVVCFGAKGDLLIENKLANRLLGSIGTDLLARSLLDATSKESGKIRLHFEVEGALIYAEGRSLEVEEGLNVTAFVLHDMSAQRDRLMLQLERSVFRAQSRRLPLTLAVLEDRSQAGRLYRQLKAVADSLQLEASMISALDAYSCACVFQDKRLRSARYLLKCSLPQFLSSEHVFGALLAGEGELGAESPGPSLIHQARGTMQALGNVLKPKFMVMDPYSAVFESLELIAGDLITLERTKNSEQAQLRMRSGEYDGIFLDVDTYASEGLEWLQECSSHAGAGFCIYYLSHQQASMVFRNYGIREGAIVFQKPFNAEKLCETLALQFDFA
jgi:PAS domain-containing protein